MATATWEPSARAPRNREAEGAQSYAAGGSRGGAEQQVRGEGMTVGRYTVTVRVKVGLNGRVRDKDHRVRTTKTKPHN